VPDPGSLIPRFAADWREGRGGVQDLLQSLTARVYPAGLPGSISWYQFRSAPSSPRIAICSPTKPESAVRRCAPGKLQNGPSRTCRRGTPAFLSGVYGGPKQPGTVQRERLVGRVWGVVRRVLGLRCCTARGGEVRPGPRLRGGLPCPWAVVPRAASDPGLLARVGFRTGWGAAKATGLSHHAAGRPPRTVAGLPARPRNLMPGPRAVQAR